MHSWNPALCSCAFSLAFCPAASTAASDAAAASSFAATAALAAAERAFAAMISDSEMPKFFPSSSTCTNQTKSLPTDTALMPTPGSNVSGITSVMTWF